MTDTKWEPWIKNTGTGRPDGLDDKRKMQVLYLNDSTKELDPVSTRCVSAHVWDQDTLAYRLEIKAETKTYVVYGEMGDTFTQNRFPVDTHKITYTVENGEVVSCVMEKL